MLLYPSRHEIRVPCPHTNRPIDIKVKTDADGLAEIWESTIRVSCEHCGMKHEVNVRDAYLEHILDTAGSRLAGE